MRFMALVMAALMSFSLSANAEQSKKSADKEKARVEFRRDMKHKHFRGRECKKCVMFDARRFDDRRRFEGRRFDDWRRWDGKDAQFRHRKMHQHGKQKRG